MSYQPAGAYEPARWIVGSCDLQYVERISSTAPATNTAWIANLAVYVPFTLNMPGTIYEWWWFNGTLTTAHNIDFGIYNLDFTKIQSLGSTVGGTGASNIVSTTTWTDLNISPGSYYMAFANDSVRNFTTTADALGTYQAAGYMEQTTAFPLPSPAVPVVYAHAFCPFFGFNMRSVNIST